MSMRVAGALGSLVLLGVLATGCGAVQTGPRLSGGDKLYEAVNARNSQVVSVIDSSSHTADRRLPLGTPTGDWKHLYSIVSTSLVDTDPVTGATLGTMSLGGVYQLPPSTANGVPGGLSPNGRWLVVESFDQTAGGLPSATHMLVVNLPNRELLRRVNLQGYFQFDAVSNDGDRLYLIQYLNGKEYYVRLYNVGAGSLDPGIVVDKSDGGGNAMVGTRLSGVASSDGHWLLSLYVRENASPFIHALSLDGPFALCLDLPGAGYAASGNGEAEVQWSLAMSRDGSHLYAVNPATGTVAVLNTSTNAGPSIVRTGRFERATSIAAKGWGANGAVVSADGATLVVAGPSGLVWIDTGTLKARARALTDWNVWSVGLSPDGSRVYAVSDSGRIAEISMASADVIAKFDPGEGQPMALMRVAVS